MATILANPKFDVEGACQILNESLKGAGTNESNIIDVLTTHDAKQRVQIRDKYQTLFGEDLVDHMRSELRDDFQQASVSMVVPTATYLAEELRESMKGPATDEKVIVDILFPRTNAELNNIKTTYETEFERNLEDDLSSETKGELKHLFIAQVNGTRDETTTVDKAKAEQDAKDIYEAGEAGMGTDESVFTMILSSRSYPQLRATFDCYADIAGKDIEESICSETNGTLQEGLITIVKYVKSSNKYFADNLNNSLKGMGTDEHSLVRTIITRSDVDLANIATEYQGLYDDQLSGTIDREVKGDLRELLMKIVGDR